MNISQRRILFILVILFLGGGFALLATRPSDNPPSSQSNQKLKEDFAAELKQAAPATNSRNAKLQFKVLWRLVIAKGKLKGNSPETLECPELDSSGKSFLAELRRRYPAIQFESPVSGEDTLYNQGNWYPFIRVKYIYDHPDLGTLHVSFPVALRLNPDKSGDKLFVVNRHEKNFHLAYDELYSSASTQNITKFIPIPPLFQPAQLPQKEGAAYITIGQTMFLQSYSCYFQKEGKKLQPIDTHMLFYRVIRPEVP